MVQVCRRDRGRDHRCRSERCVAPCANCLRFMFLQVTALRSRAHRPSTLRAERRQRGASPWLERPAADLLQSFACSGPRVIVRSWSSCPRSIGSSGSMGLPHRQQVRAPARWSGAREFLVVRCLPVYPRALVVPRALSRSLVWVGHRLVPWGTGVGHPASAQGCLARGMGTSLPLVPAGPYGSRPYGGGPWWAVPVVCAPARVGAGAWHRVGWRVGHRWPVGLRWPLGCCRERGCSTGVCGRPACRCCGLWCAHREGRG